MSSIRKPPLTTPHREGICDWCDQPVPKKFKKNGQPYQYQPQWHRECWHEYRAAMNPTLFFDDLAERDGLCCSTCGEAPHGWEPRNPPEIVYVWDPECKTSWEACRVEYRPLLDVDHRIPLWKVRDLPPVKRREYFKLPNLQLLCRGEAGGRCHVLKSAAEAAERAHLRRLANGKKERKGKAISSRPFDTRYRRKLNGDTVIRNG